jgi:hypothetical protein
MSKKKSQAMTDFKAKLKENADKVAPSQLQQLIDMIPKDENGTETRRYRRLVKKVTEKGKLPKGLRKRLKQANAISPTSPSQAQKTQISQTGPQ